jgi:tRNA(fMet)-specific endonuclease VapC
MRGEILLDTNFVIAVFGRDQAALTRLQRAGHVYLPVVALGELYFGAHRSARIADNLARIEDFATSNEVLGCDIETARVYGRLHEDLKRRGSPIPDNDIWIAATAMQHNLTLVSRDAHFREIEGLAVESWS